MSSSPLFVYSLDRAASCRSAVLVLAALGLVVSVLLWLWFGARATQETAGGAKDLWIAAMLLLGCGPLVAWAVDMRRYIGQDRWDASSGIVELSLLGPLGGRVVRVAPAEFAEVVRLEGRLAIPFSRQGRGAGGTGDSGKMALVGWDPEAGLRAAKGRGCRAGAVRVVRTSAWITYPRARARTPIAMTPSANPSRGHGQARRGRRAERLPRLLDEIRCWRLSARNSMKLASSSGE